MYNSPCRDPWTQLIKKMNKLLSLLPLLMLAMFTFTACNDDDDDDDSDGQNNKSVETLMTTLPTSFGWSGESVNGVLYYYPEQNTNEVKQRLLTRASDDDDEEDDEEDVNIQIFCAYHMNEGKVTGALYDAIVCLRFEDKATAKLYYDMVKSGTFSDEDEENEEDDDIATQNFIQACKKYVKLSNDGKTLYFPQDNLSNLSSEELVKCMQVWTAIYADENSWDDVAPLVGSDDEILFGGSIDDNGNYQSNLLTDKLTFASMYGLERVSLTKLSASSVRLTLQFSSAEYARYFYLNSILDGDTPEEHPDDTLSGNTVNEVSTWYDTHKAILITDILYNIPLFFEFFFD